MQGSFFGTAVALVGSVNGDDEMELVTLAARDRTYAVEGHVAYVLSEDGTVAGVEVPSEAAGANLGAKSTTAWFDPDGDGVLDLVGGAMGQPANVVNSGEALRWTGLDSGADWSEEPDQVWAGLPLQGAFDWLGAGVASAGQFAGPGGREALVVLSAQEDRPSSFDPAWFANPTECPGSVADGGAAWVFEGTAATPSFVAFGEAASDRMEVVDGGFDHNGDGYDDVVVGSVAIGTEGGFLLLRGRPSDPNGIVVICDAATWDGVTGSSRLGSSVAGIGDLDGDGCDELAVGADADDLGRNNQGSVRVLWGFGATCQSDAPEVTTLVSGRSNDRLGVALDGGQDVDGDGVPDLVVAASEAEASGQDVGAVWLASGAWVRSLARQSASTLPADEATQAHGLLSTHRRAGTVFEGQFGSDVALVPDPERQGRALVAVGHRYGAEGGVERTGGVVVLRWEDSGFAPEPIGIIGGETSDPWSQLGAGLRSDPRAAVLAVGVPLSDATELDAGTVYPFALR